MSVFHAGRLWVDVLVYKEQGSLWEGRQNECMCVCAQRGHVVSVPRDSSCASGGPLSWAELVAWPSSCLPDSAAEGTHSCCTEAVNSRKLPASGRGGEGWGTIRRGSLALGEQKRLPQGRAPKKVQTKVCFAHYKDTSVRGPWRGGLWGWGCFARGPYWEPTEAIVSCWTGKRRGQSQSSRVWELWGHLPCDLQPAPKHSCLLLPKEAGPKGGGGVPPCWRAGLKGPHPGGSRMTGQGLTEASEGREGGVVLSSRPSGCLEGPGGPPGPLAKPPLRSDPLACPTPFLLHASGAGLFSSGSHPRAYL